MQYQTHLLYVIKLHQFISEATGILIKDLPEELAESL